MSRFRDAWLAFTGRGYIPNPPPSGDAIGVVQRLQPLGSPARRAAVEAPRAYTQHPVLRMVVGKIATSISRHVPRLYRVNRKGEKVEVLEHPALLLLRRPNELLTGLQTRKVSQLQYELCGETFWLLWANDKGEPVQFFPIPPRWIVRVPERGRQTFWLSHHDLQEEIPAASVLWMKDVNPENPYARGAGIAEALSDEVDVDEYAAKYVKTFFYNRASPEIIVSAEGAKKSETDAAKAKWDEDHRGWWNGFRTFWTGSKITVTRLDTTFRDSQLTELRGFQRDMIVSTWGVPPEVLGIVENSNRATIDGSETIYAKHVIEPRLATQADYLNERLLPMYGDYETREGRLLFEYVNVIPDDREFTKSVMAARPAAFTDNEARVLAGLPEAEGKDEYPAPAPAFGALSARDQDPEWTRRLPRGKRNAGTAADAQRALEALRPEAVTYRIKPVMQEGTEAWAKQALSDLGASAKFDLLNPLIPKYVEADAAKRITGDVHETTQKALRETLAEGVRAGESVDDLAVRIEDVFDLADTSRAEMIARTEVVGASNWATREAQRVSGVVERRAWVATRDGRERTSHRDLDGKEAGLDEPFKFESGENEGKPVDYPGGSGIAGEDINCFPGDVVVETFGGASTLFRRAYSGEIVDVTTEDGHSLSGTPNHPVLTARGWVALADLDESDDLVYTLGGDVVGATDAHPDHEPLAFQEVADLLAAEGATVRAQSARAQDFHGDGREAEVDVVAIDGEFGQRMQSARLKQLAQAALAASGAGSHSLLADRTGDSDVLVRAPSEQRSASGGSAGSAGFVADAAGAQSVGVRSPTRLDAGGDESGTDAGAGETERLSQGLLALAGKVAANEVVGVYVGPQSGVPVLLGAGVDPARRETTSDGVSVGTDAPRDLADGQPSGVKFCRVVEKRVRQFSGHVHNLQTQHGMYTANGFAVHNCRCTTVAVISDDLDESEGALHAKNITTERLDAVFRAYDRRLSSWERNTKSAAQAGFGEQRRDVLKALRSSP